MKRLKFYILSLLLAASLCGCDITIHEYPEELPAVKVPVVLDLAFNTEMPLYSQETWHTTRSSSTDSTRFHSSGLDPELFDLRYVIKAYKAANVRQIRDDLVDTFIFTKDDISQWDNKVQVELVEGDYVFVVWADYVDAGSRADKYYDTNDFSNIFVIGDLQGSNDYRDAFRGRVITSVEMKNVPIGKDQLEIVIPMIRPMAKYRFISNDLESFISRMTLRKLEQQRNEETKGDDIEDETKSETTRTPIFSEGPDYTNSRSEAIIKSENPDGEAPGNGSGEDTKVDGEDTKGDGEDTKGDDTKGDDSRVVIDLADYYVVFTYPDWVTVAYNAIDDITGGPKSGLKYKSDIIKISNTEAEIGFDYIFVCAKTEVKVSLEVFQNDGTSIAAVQAKFLPLLRSRLTEVRGSFLTSKAQMDGVGINPDFDDGWDIVVGDRQ